MKERPFSPADMNVAYEAFNAMCGHGALAAALGCPVLHVMPLFGRGGWVNIPMMKDAIHAAGKSFIKSVSIPEQGSGVVIVQWLGAWMKPGVPAAARCAFRHWIGLCNGEVWDSNCQHWMTLREWEEWLPGIYPRHTTGHKIEAAWMLGPIIRNPQSAIRNEC